VKTRDKDSLKTGYSTDLDANENQETVVHIAVPVETVRDVVNRMEEVGI
jgi:hypothetical protein